MSEAFLPDGYTLDSLEKLSADAERIIAGQHIFKGFSDWPEPERLAESLPDVARFDLDLMPTSLRPVVKDVAERMQVPMDFPAVVAIETLAGLTNRRAIIQPKRDDNTWTVVPNLWGGIIAPPGMMKSPVISSITRPARMIEAEWREEHRMAESSYRVANELHEEEVKAWRALNQTAIKKATPRPSKPELMLEPPALRRLITSDATFESLQDLQSENPAGIFVLRDELTGWLAGLERQGREGERSFYLECWNGDSAFTIDRIGRGSIHVAHTCISLFGGIQPARLRAYLADALQDGPSNDGLMQRFQLLVWPDLQPEWKYIDRIPDSAAMESAESVYRRVAALDERNPLRLQFDGEAQLLFEQWFTELEQRIRGDELSPAMQAHLAKYRSLMPSLALLLAIADGATKNVLLEHAQRACDWCDYLETHAHRVYASQAKPEHHAAIALSRKLAKGWKRGEDSFTLREVYRNKWTGLDSAITIRKALQVLEECGWVRALDRGETCSVGRPSEVYLRNPRIEVAHAGK
ncbi:YfjI family protein [Granulicella sp. dw_53]|uniref:YfjI family protein n=1 Tax=Granulicella sp. dw_53 TaxID=2719792 RepID=UPI001BD5FC9C|nr:YfjI family protein [Granulicella sp. dw_53]